jgi:hypothetical protein
MERCRRWLDLYMGPGHGVGLGVSECGSIASGDPNVVAAWYASHLGTFASEGVELFTPWEWHPGQWEVLHLFSRYFGSMAVSAVSSLDTLVSAYASLGGGGDSMIVVLVNRDRTSGRTAAVSLTGFSPSASSCATLRISGLPSDSETFVSHEKNALVKGSLPLSDAAFTADLPALSVTAVILSGKAAAPVRAPRTAASVKISARVRGNTLVVAAPGALDGLSVSLYTLRGECVRKWSSLARRRTVASLKGLSSGRYLAVIENGNRRTVVDVVRE